MLRVVRAIDFMLVAVAAAVRTLCTLFDRRPVRPSFRQLCSLAVTSYQRKSAHSG